MTTPTPPPSSNAEVIILEWQDLTSSDETSSSSTIAKKLHQAFGPTGLGLVAIRGVPGFVQAKQAFLPLAHTLAHLPDKHTLEDPDSLYNAGWSRGQEKLRHDQPDYAKGSFYYNPLTDLPGTPEQRAAYPLSYPANIWPSAGAVAANFRTAARTIGGLLRHAVVVLAAHLDSAAHAHAADCYYPPHLLLHDALKDSDKVKARLLYYYPLKHSDNKKSSSSSSVDDDDDDDDSWIGWHDDSGFLTALAGDLYVHHETGQVVDCPDPQAGLYVAVRGQQQQQPASCSSTSTSSAVRVEIPPDCLAVQMGECAQIVSGGVWCATPHAVRGIRPSCHDNNTNNNNSHNNNNIARISLPCFVDAPPSFGLSMPDGCTRQKVLDAAVPHSRVPPLGQRWTRDGMPFGDFLQKTFAQYYDWDKSRTETTDNNNK